jgi:hypothetical protein
MKANDVKIRSEHDGINVEDFYKEKLKFYNRLLKNGVFISSKYKKYNNIAMENIKTYIKENKGLLGEVENGTE